MYDFVFIYAEFCLWAYYLIMCHEIPVQVFEFACLFSTLDNLSSAANVAIPATPLPGHLGKY